MRLSRRPLVWVFIGADLFVAVAALILVAQGSPVVEIIECIGRYLSDPPCSPVEVHAPGVGGPGPALVAFAALSAPALVAWWVVVRRSAADEIPNPSDPNA